jgi:hypothetical protein
VSTQFEVAAFAHFYSTQKFVLFAVVYTLPVLVLGGAKTRDANYRFSKVFKKQIFR